MTEKQRSGSIDSDIDKQRVITVNGNYRGAIKLSVEHNTLKGQLMADDMNVAGVDIETAYTDAQGIEKNGRALTDRIGRFNDRSHSFPAGDSIIAAAHVQTPVGNRLNISAKLIELMSIDANFIKTEDILSYLVTENDEHFVAE